MIEFSPSRRIAHDCGDFSILAQRSRLAIYQFIFYNFINLFKYGILFINTTALSVTNSTPKNR